MKTIKIIGLAVIILIIAAFGVRFFSGPEDTWLCRNGRWVKHGRPSAPPPATACGERIKRTEIMVTEPLANQQVNSPITVRGQARGNWFFEAAFPVQLIFLGEVIAQSAARAKGDWLTDDLVPFEAVLKPDLSLLQKEINLLKKIKSAELSAVLVLKSDNPSGLPGNEKKFEVPILISLIPNMTVKAFFSNNNLDPAVSCDKVFPINRQVVKTVAAARAALEELLKGPTAAEKASGYYTGVNSGVVIKKLTIANGTAKVDFDETMEKNLGGSCRVSAIRAQITQTLKQFSTVKNVIISIDGRTEDILQP